MHKDFANWHKTKETIDNKGGFASFKEREIWWCSLGVNIGHEEDGKGPMKTRPVLILKKFNKRLFWGVPLTTQIKDNTHYYEFNFLNKRQSIMLTQLRLWDAKRLISKMGRLMPKEHTLIMNRLSEYFL